MSDKSIAQKLFIKPGNQIPADQPSAGYLAQMGELPAGAILLSDSSSLVEVIQALRREPGWNWKRSCHG